MLTGSQTERINYIDDQTSKKKPHPQPGGGTMATAGFSSTMKMGPSINFGRKDELVERVMESIKTLSKKEEEAAAGGGKKKKKEDGGAVLNYKNPPNSAAALSVTGGTIRKRTNTFTTSGQTSHQVVA
jgi:hypothetical protein